MDRPSDEFRRRASSRKARATSGPASSSPTTPTKMLARRARRCCAPRCRRRRSASPRADHDDRRRRLRRDARDVAVDEVVEHQIADTEHRRCREPSELLFEAVHRRTVTPALDRRRTPLPETVVGCNVTGRRSAVGAVGGLAGRARWRWSRACLRRSASGRMELGSA